MKGFGNSLCIVSSNIYLEGCVFCELNERRFIVKRIYN